MAHLDDATSKRLLRIFYEWGFSLERIGVKPIELPVTRGEDDA